MIPPSKLLSYGSVSQQIPPHVRNPDLSFEEHRPIPNGEQMFCPLCSMLIVNDPPHAVFRIVEDGSAVIDEPFTDRLMRQERIITEHLLRYHRKRYWMWRRLRRNWILGL